MAKTKKMAFGGMSESLARQNANQDRRDLRAAGGPGDTAAQKAMMDYQQQYKQHARGMEHRQQRAAERRDERREQQGVIPTGGSMPPRGLPGSTQMGPQRMQNTPGLVMNGPNQGAQQSQTPPPPMVQAAAQQAIAQAQQARQNMAPGTGGQGTQQQAMPPALGRTFGDRMAAQLAAQNSGVPQYGQGPGQGFGQPPNAAKVGMFKKGGAVKTAKMGAVKVAKPKAGSASSRGDGIAQRGKTRGSLR